jgi:DHA1 family bicyclomycin/chloramphenicol resistance-like MFS transporter
MKKMKLNDSKSLFAAFIIMLTTVPMFSTDMYLPALPKMVELFGGSLKLVNMTLIVFFVLFAASSLIWGTLSDKYGRKPVLVISLGTYAVSSLLCAFSGNIYQLILFRALQGAGGGAAMAISMALVKDVFTGKARERVLVYQSCIMSIAPVVAPIAGAGILRFTSWHGTFVVLFVFGVILFLGSLLMREPSSFIKDPDKNLRKTFGSLKTLAGSPGFALPLILFSVSAMPILMFVGSASDIYISNFGLSEQSFGFFFGFNAAIAAIGPFVYILLARRFSPQALIGLSFFLMAASGLWVVLSGNYSPIIFALAATPLALGTGLNRPPGMNIMLEQGKQDAGAASSLINFMFIATGCVGMFFISLDWENRILVYGISALGTGLFALLFWPKAWEKCNPALLYAGKQ